MRRMLIALALALTLCGAPGQADPEAPPGINVHLVVSRYGGSLWRGAAPRRETLLSLARQARYRRSQVTLIDLRHPDNADDRSGKDGRLSPAAEARLAEKLGLRYISISALDKTLPSLLDEALGQGDVYMHCMYGVNRTGFATARFAVADGEAPGREGLGTRDWQQGEDFQKRQVH